MKKEIDEVNGVGKLLGSSMAGVLLVRNFSFQFWTDTATPMGADSGCVDFTDKNLHYLFMIQIDRSTVRRPRWFGSAEWTSELTKLEDYLSSVKSKQIQRRSSSLLARWPDEVMAAVRKLFDSRCAMCESPVTSKTSSVARFRPLECEDTSDRFMFAYAALLWENLILLCNECERMRGNRFPLMSAERTRASSKGEKRNMLGGSYGALEGLLRVARKYEKPYLIEPTIESPAKLITFDSRCYAVSASESIREEQRANMTIELFQLNRPLLVERRRKALMPLQKALKIPQFGPGTVSKDAGVRKELADLIDLLGGEFQAAKAAYFIDWYGLAVDVPLPKLLRQPSFLSGAALSKAEHLLLPMWNARFGRKELREPTPQAIRVKANPSPTRAKSLASATYQSFSKARIERVRISNFRHFETEEFLVPTERPDDSFGPDRQLTRQIRSYLRKTKVDTQEPEEYCGWKMILGENGVGKSSILQAVAVALIADQKGKDALTTLTELQHSIPPDTEGSMIEVWFSDRKTPVRVAFEKSRHNGAESGDLVVSVRGGSFNRKTGSKSAPDPLYLRGYGATRLLPPRAQGAPFENSQETHASPVGNLFDPYAPLTAPNEWLQGLDADGRRLAFIALKDLLDLPEHLDLEFKEHMGRQTLCLVDGDKSSPLSHFSAGYQSIVVLGCDIMAGFGEKVGDMHYRTGVVLLDEVGANLHPRWRLRIVQALRRTFPQIQFIASTHEPLCLRGLGKGEVALLQRRKEDRKIILRDDELPSPSCYRVDQLLTGDFFGLETAYDPDEEAAFDVYHKLLVDERASLDEGPELTQEQKELLVRLEALLKDRLTLGDTAAERRLMTALQISEEEGPDDPNKKEFLPGSDGAKIAANRILQRIKLQPPTA